MPDETDPDIWAHDTLEVDDEGYVTGSAYTVEKDGHDVQVSVTSYEYERRGKTRMNHVPNVVVTDASGAIVAEPHSLDSESPTKAIRYAKRTAENVFENLSEHI